MTIFFKKSYMATAFFFILLAAVETTFNAAAYAYIFRVIEEKNVRLLVVYVAVVVAGYCFFSAVTYLKDYWTNKNLAFFNINLKTELIKKILEKEAYSSNQTAVSKHTSFFMNELKLLEESYVKQVFQVLSHGVTMMVILAFSINNSFVLTVIFLAFTSVTPLFTKVHRGKIEKANSRWTSKNQKFSSILKDVLEGAETITAYKSERHFLKKFREKASSLEESSQAMNNAISLSNATVIAVSYLFMYFPIGIGMYWVIQGELPLASFVAVQYSSSWIVNNFLGLSQCINKLNSTKEIQKKIKTFLEFNKPETTNLLKGQQIESIVFREVSFAYGDKHVFEQLNMELHSNDNVLLEGASGSGKSTFLKLLTKKLLPTSGEIYINGQNLKAISKNELYDYMSLVPQTVALFSGTLKENVTLGREVSDEELSEAIKKAGLEELVKQRGLDYHIGESGEGLSGGQLKRIEIARAILFNKPILLIDEGNASLDKRNALSINQTIARLNKLIVDVEHYIPEESMANYTRKYYLENNTLKIS